MDDPGLFGKLLSTEEEEGSDEAEDKPPPRETKITFSDGMTSSMEEAMTMSMKNGTNERGRATFATTHRYFQQKHTVQLAAQYVCAAIRGRKKIAPVADTPEAQKANLLRLQIAFMVRATLWILVMMTFAERPQWMITQAESSNKHNPTFVDTFLDRFQTFWIETICVSVLLFDTYLGWAAKGRIHFQEKVDRVYAIALMITALDVVYAYVTPYSWTRIGPFMRIILLALSDSDMHGQFLIIYKILPDFISITGLLTFFIFVYAWLGTVLFQSIDHSGNFSTIGNAIWSLVILATTNNFPDVMMPTYNYYRPSCLYFILYLSFVVFFALNMVTALVYHFYSQQSKERAKDIITSKQQHLRQAFKLLDVHQKGKLNMVQIMDLFWEINALEEVSYIDENKARLLFGVLDNSGDMMVNLEEFETLPELMEIRFMRLNSMRCLKNPKNKRYKLMESIVMSRYFELFVDGLLVLNTALFIWRNSSHAGSLSHKTWVHSCQVTIDLVLTVFFVLEAALKIFLLSWVPYIEDWGNRFDFVITVATLITTAYVLYPNDFNDRSIIRFVLILRVLRTLRLMVHITHLKLVCATFTRVLPAAKRLLQMMFTMFFMFSCLGLILFGGRINTNPKDPNYKKLKGSDFEKADYMVNNFNDMMSGFVTLFEFLVLNNWPLVTQGIFLTTPFPGSASAYFIAFYLLCILICLNISVAFVIDSVLPELQEREDHIQEVGEVTFKHHTAQFNAETLTGTETGLQGQYKAVMPLHLEHIDNQAAMKFIRNMFAIRNRNLGDSTGSGEPNVTDSPSQESSTLLPSSTAQYGSTSNA